MQTSGNVEGNRHTFLAEEDEGDVFKTEVEIEVFQDELGVRGVDFKPLPKLSRNVHFLGFEVTQAGPTIQR